MTRTSRALWMVLIAALLVVRVAIVEHEIDFKAHQPGDSCELCLHASPIKGGASMPALTIVVPGPAVAEFIRFNSAVPSITPLRSRARGPPVANSIV